MFYKAARVEYHPVGVVGAIVPWNYPFHNVFNPLTAALFSGNGLVIKVNRTLQLMASAPILGSTWHEWLLGCRSLSTHPGPHSSTAASSQRLCRQ